MKIFYAMPFTGKTYEQIVNKRKNLNNLANSFNLQFLEQFIGLEEKKKFESHAYGPLFIAKKDFNLIKQADLIIADYNQASIGRDYEIAVAKEEYDKRCVAIVTNNFMQNHPWIRLYNDYIVSTPKEAFNLAQKLSSWPFALTVSKLTRNQKDEIDLKVKQLIQNDKSLQLLIELLPTELKRRWQKLFGPEYKNVLKFSFKQLPLVFRVNTLKTNKREIFKIAKKYSWILKSLKFSPIAYEVSPESNNFEKIPEYGKGYFYVQQASSMLSVIALNPKPGEKILEIGAAPGSKTTQIASMTNNKGVLIANEVSLGRISILSTNLQRCGVTNTLVIRQTGESLCKKLVKLNIRFDKVLADVPCSGEGTIRSSPKTVQMFSENLIKNLSNTQKYLATNALKVLKLGGDLIYSTCTHAPEENEAIISYLLDNFPVEIQKIELPLKTRPGITKWKDREYNKDVSQCVRIYPQDNNTEGFFIAHLKKTGEIE